MYSFSSPYLARIFFFFLGNKFLSLKSLILDYFKEIDTENISPKKCFFFSSNFSLFIIFSIPHFFVLFKSCFSKNHDHSFSFNFSTKNTS